MRATTPLAQGSAPYTETASSASYQNDNLPHQLVDGRGRAIDLAVPAPNRDGTESFRAEGVSTSYSYESFGRPTHSTGAGAGGPVTSLTYGVDRKGRAGAGLLERVEQGQGAMSAEIQRDDADNVRAATASSGARSELEHDAWDRPVRIVDGLGSGAGVPPAGTLVAPGRRLERAFDAAGRIVAERRLQDYADADGTVQARWVEARYEYNERDQLVAVERSHVASPLAAGVAIPALTRVAERHYDEHGRLADDLLLNLAAAPRTTHYTYDAAGRVASARVGDAGERRVGYDPLGRAVLRTDGDAGTWFARHDAWGRRWSELEPSGAVVRRFFGPAGNLTMEERWDGDPAAGSATLLARREAEITSFGAVVREAEHRRAGAGGVEALVVERQLDPSGRLVAEWSGPAGPDGRLQQASARRERELAYEPLAGRVVSEATGGAWGSDPVQRTTYLYGPDSRASWPDAVTTWESVPGSSGLLATATASYAHDAAGHVLAETWSDGRTFVHDYDRSGERIRTRDGAGTLTASSLDGRGLLLRAIRPQGRGATAYAYELDGRLVLQQVTAAAGTWDTRHEYDLSGRRTRTEHPDGTAETFAFNSDDTLSRWTTRDGVGVEYTYDEANRVLAAVPTLVAGAVLSGGLAPLDGGDAFAYDRMSRLLSAGRRPAAAAPLDHASLVALSGYDLAGNPAAELVGSRDPLAFTYDAWSRPIGLGLPAGLMADSTAPLEGFSRTYTSTDQLAAVAPLGGPSSLGAAWTWGGGARLYGVATAGPLSLAARYGYLGGAGVQPCGDASDTPWRLGAIAIGPAGASAATSPPASEWGRLGLGWRPGDGAKRSRSASPTCGGVLAGLGWAYELDAGARLVAADGPDRFSFDYAEGDELLTARRDGTAERSAFTLGPEGRIAERDDVPFAYLPSGRRIADDRSTYTWDWRGRLVAVNVNATWASTSGEPVTPTFAGHLLRYEHDGLGRLLARTHLGPLPEGSTDDTQRPFIERRSFLWEGNALRAELAHGSPDGALLRWRKTYLPGPTGLDDAVQVRVERFDPAGSPLPASDVVYTIVRDELGTVIGLVDEAAVSNPSHPELLARYRYTPYGEAHLESGPEIEAAAFDETVTAIETAAGAVSQAISDPSTAAPGALVISLSLPLDGATLAAGLLLEVMPPSGAWESVPSIAWVAGRRPASATIGHPGEGDELVVLPLSGWTTGAHYRIRLTPALRGIGGRALATPRELDFAVPAAGQPGAAYAERFPTAFDTPAAAWSTLGDTFPGGQPLLFHGLWHDPVTGLAYARARWYDPRNASWLSEDPVGDVDSPNLYAYVAWQPHMATDPLGTCGWWSDTDCVEEMKQALGAVKTGAGNAVRAVRDFFGRFNRGTATPGNPDLGEAADDIAELERSTQRAVDAGRAVGEGGYAVGNTAWEMAPTGAITGTARAIDEAKAGNLRGAAIEAALTVPDLIPGLGFVDEGMGATRSLRTAGTRFEKAASASADAGITATHSSLTRDVAAATARLWRYPQAIDLRTGRAIPFPTGELHRLHKADRVMRAAGARDRGEFIAEWYRRGFPTPRGGWENYVIHHIRPLEFGGAHDFWNMVPVTRQTHAEYNDYWRQFAD